MTNKETSEWEETMAKEIHSLYEYLAPILNDAQYNHINGKVMQIARLARAEAREEVIKILLEKFNDDYWAGYDYHGEAVRKDILEALSKKEI